MWLAMKNYRARLNFFRENVCFFLLFSLCAASEQGLHQNYDLNKRLTPGTTLSQYGVCPQVDAVVKIQAFFRASKAREEYRMLGEFPRKRTSKQECFILIVFLLHFS